MDAVITKVFIKLEKIILDESNDNEIFTDININMHINKLDVSVSIKTLVDVSIISLNMFLYNTIKALFRLTIFSNCLI